MSFSIKGTGVGLPKLVVTNDDLSKIMETSDEWISQRTGIRERRIITDETLTEISAQAAKNALEDAGITADELDLIISANIRGEFITPSLACMVQKELGATCPAFDINAACSGFIYALDIADGFFARGKVRNVLVLAAEEMSTFLDWNDRSTCVLFGDGAAAAVLGEGDGLRAIRLTAEGNDEVLMAYKSSGNSPFLKREEHAPLLHMKGQEVFKFAVSSMCRDVQLVAEDAGVLLEDVEHIIPHQANMRIIELARRMLGIPEEKMHSNIAHYGNTSAVGAVILLDELNRGGALKKGEMIIMSSFGGGLTTGACAIKWDK